MRKMPYTKPEVTLHQQLRFETWISGHHGDFPGLGWGVGGNTVVPEGEGSFPGKGHGYGWKKWDAGH